MKEVVIMFVIKDSSSRFYFANKNKIILFEDPNLAGEFANAFIQYSMQRIMQEEGPFGVGKVMQLSQTLQVIPVDFNLEKVETITFHDLCENR